MRSLKFLKWFYGGLLVETEDGKILSYFSPPHGEAFVYETKKEKQKFVAESFIMLFGFLVPIFSQFGLKFLNLISEMNIPLGFLIGFSFLTVYAAFSFKSAKEIKILKADSEGLRRQKQCALLIFFLMLFAHLSLLSDLYESDGMVWIYLSLINISIASYMLFVFAKAKWSFVNLLGKHEENV